MRIVFLGTGAGGGVPQWNCNCTYCMRARQRNGRVRPRREAAIAVSTDGARWVILDAPMELGAMLRMHPYFIPDTTRGTRIHAVVLLHGDVNHAVGVLTFRGPISDVRTYVSVYSTARVQQTLLDRCALFRIVKAHWEILPLQQWIPITGPDGTPTEMEIRAIPVPGKPPTYHWEDHTENTVAIHVRDPRTGTTLTYAPIVREITPDLLDAFRQSRCIILDGTFWYDHELMDIDPQGGRSAYAIGHIPVQDSLPVLQEISAPYRIYTHINNTNPLNDPASEAYHTVRAAGIYVAVDGMEIDLAAARVHIPE